MAILKTAIDPTSDEYQANAAAMTGLVAELRANLDAVKRGGGPEALKKHLARNKLPVRERVRLLCDRGTPFLEFSALAAHGMYNGDAPAAGMVTGIGAVNGQECVIVGNVATVKGGTY